MKNNFVKLSEISFFILILGILVMSCKSKKEEESAPEYVLSGKVYSSCGSPLSNANLVLYQEGNSTLTGISDAYQESTTSDAQGNFSVKFKYTSNQFIQLRYNNVTILNDIPFGKDVNDIVAFLTASACIQVKLNVLNPHSSADTLKITNFNGNEDLKIPGPLTSGLLYTAGHYPFSDASYKGKSARVAWHFNAYAGVYEKQDFVINKYCNDTIFVTATIN